MGLNLLTIYSESTSWFNCFGGRVLLCFKGLQNVHTFDLTISIPLVGTYYPMASYKCVQRLSLKAIPLRGVHYTEKVGNF